MFTKVENCAEAYLELLRVKGVKYFFMNPGTDTVPINDAFVKFYTEGKKEPRLILIPHENAAVSMAYGYTMITGEPQVVMVHVIVGTANALGAVMNAHRGRIPIIFTAGRTPITEEGLPGSRDIRVHWGQESYDQGSIIREFVKWDYELRTCRQLSTVVYRAFKIALTEPQGPVYLMLPREWLMEEMKVIEIPPPEKHLPPSPPCPNPVEIEIISKALINADNPLIITGYLGRRVEAVNKLIELAELLAIPVIEQPRARMNFPTENPLHLGYDPHPYLHDADVVLLIDTDIPWIPKRGKLKEEAKILQIDLDPLHTSIPIWGFPVDLPVVSDSDTALSFIISKVNSLQKSFQKEKISERRDAITGEHGRQRSSWREDAERVKDSKPIDFLWLSHVINEVKDEDTIIINEYDLRLNQIKQNVPGTYFSTSSVGHLGLGFGSALGAKLAKRDGTIIACLGDGSYIFGNPTACHWAAMTYRLPILIVIFNNMGYGVVRRVTRNLIPKGWSIKQNKFMGSILEPSQSFADIAKANGGYGETVVEPSELETSLLRGLEVVKKKHKHALIDVICRK